MGKRTLNEDKEYWKLLLKSIVDKVIEKLIENGYDSDSIAQIVKLYKPKMDIIDGDYILYYGDNIIAKTNGKSDMNSFIMNANKNLSKFIIDKINFNMNENKTIIKLNENELKKVIKESVKTIINEISNTSIKKSYINKLYRITHDITSHIYKDDDWRNVNKAISIIENFIGNDGEVYVWCENGGYWKQIHEFPNYKEYKIRIELKNGIEINGSLKCHAAGTMDDVFSRYDITITFY